MIVHPIPPLYDGNSQILILGSFPSVKSREAEFFYGHPQNRFWRVVAAVFDKEIPQTIEDKKRLLHSCHVALWDVLASCDIDASADSTIRNATPNDISGILNNSRIKRIFVNGKTAQKYYDRYLKPQTQIDAVCLPSTSPANAAWSVDRLVQAWKVIADM